MWIGCVHAHTWPHTLVCRHFAIIVLIYGSTSDSSEVQLGLLAGQDQQRAIFHRNVPKAVARQMSNITRRGRISIGLIDVENDIDVFFWRGPCQIRRTGRRGGTRLGDVRHYLSHLYEYWMYWSGRRRERVLIRFLILLCCCSTTLPGSPSPPRR